jgi:hypothetical protein
MNKAQKQKLQDLKNKQQEKTMSAQSNNKPDVETVIVNPDAQKAKTIGPEETSDPKNVDAKKEEKTGVFELILSGPKYIYDKVIVPAYDFVKGSVLKLRDKIVERYAAELALWVELGPSKYLLDRGAKMALGLLKMGAVVTAAYFLSMYTMSTFGIALFAPTTLLIVASIALVMIIAKSVMDQKDSGAKFSAQVTGSHIVESIMAA